MAVKAVFQRAVGVGNPCRGQGEKMADGMVTAPMAQVPRTVPTATGGGPGGKQLPC
jgi:hypothetical protein